MSVYVDEPKYKYGRMIMCHMIADTLEELHEMADSIEVRRKWFQNDASWPHYDICKAKRAIAVKIGAIEVTSRELIGIIKQLRHPEPSRPPEHKPNYGAYAEYDDDFNGRKR